MPESAATRMSQTGIDILVQRVAQIESPFGQEYARGLIKSEWGIDVPTPEEHELAKATTAKRFQDIQDAQRMQVVRTVVGFLVDNKGRPADEALGELGARFGILPAGPVGSGSLQDYMREQGLPGALDIGLLERPEELQGASTILAQAMGAPELQIRTEDLLAFPLTQKAASMLPEARAAEETQEEARTLRAAGDVTAARQQFVRGKDAKGNPDPLAQAMEGVFEGEEDLHERLFGASLDLDPTAFDDLEDLGGAQALVSAMSKGERLAASQGIRTSTFVPMMLETERGQRIGEVLEDRIQLDPETGAVSPTDDVSATYLQFLDKASQESGLRVDHILQLIGLGNTGATSIDLRGLRASVEAGGVQ